MKDELNSLLLRVGQLKKFIEVNITSISKNKAEFDRIMEKYPHTYLFVNEVLSKRSQSANAIIEDIEKSIKELISTNQTNNGKKK